MNNQEIIHEFNNMLHKVYKQESLTCLKKDKRYKINNKDMLSRYFEIANNRKSGNKNFNYVKNYDNLLTRSDEILHFSGLLFLYRPYINNPMDAAYFTPDGVIYINDQNLEAKRYYIYADVTSEKLYNYWERIGDLIASFFPERYTEKEKIYFSKAIDKIPKEYRYSDPFKWLKSFKENEYKELNSNYRKQVVHSISTDTEDRFNHGIIANQKDKMDSWVTARHNLADFYKKHIELTIEGIYQTLCFLEEVTNSNNNH